MSAQEFKAHFAQQLARSRVEQADVPPVPWRKSLKRILHLNFLPDPPQRRAVVGSIDLDAAIRMNRRRKSLKRITLAVLVVAERL